MRKILSLILTFLILSSLAIAPVWADDDEITWKDAYAAPLSAAKGEFIGGKASNYANKGNRLEGFTAGGYVGFKEVNFDRNPSRLDYHCGLSSNLRTNLEVRLDSPTGKLLVSAPVKLSDWSKGLVQTVEITEKVTGIHDVYFITTDSTIHFYNFQFYTDEVIKYVSPYLTYNDTIRYPDVVDNPYYNDIITALDLELIQEYATEEFKPNIPITRHEFSKAVYDIMELSPTLENYFNDVTAETPNYDAINAVRENGYLKGTSQTEFSPYNFVSTFDASVVAIRMLGYEHMATLKGGYPIGYKLVANELGLFSGLTDGEVLRRDTFARWIVNVLNANYADITEIENGSVHYDNVSGLLSKTRKIQKGTGVVTANQFGSIYTALGNTVKNFIEIDGVSYYAENTYAPAFIGMKCDFYYVERNGRFEIISIVPSNQANIQNLEGYSMKTLDNTAVTYYKDEAKTKTATLKTDINTIFLVNGKAVDTSIRNLVSASDFKGQVLWVDNNNNNVADVVILWIPETFELNTVSANKLGDKLTSSSNTKFGQNKTSNITNADIVYFLNGEEVKKAEIPMGSIVQVYESKNTNGTKIVRICAMDTPVSATITEISKDKVYLDGIPYKTDITVNVNKSGNFYIDKYNHIVHFVEGAKAEDTIGLFIAAATDSVGAFGDQKLEVKLWTKATGIKIYEVAEKAIIDGLKFDDFASAAYGRGAYTGVTTIDLNSPIRFRLNADGKLTFIDSLLEGAKDDNDTMKALYTGGGTIYYRTVMKVFTISSGITFDYPMNHADGIVFHHYSGADGTLSTDYTSEALSGFYNNKYIRNAEIYSSKGSFLGDIAISRGRSTGSYSKSMFILGKGMGIDKNGEPAIRITVYISNGTKKTYTISTKAYSETTTDPTTGVVSNSTLKTIIDNIEVGDIIRVKTDSNGEISAAISIFTNDGKADNGYGIANRIYNDTVAGKTVAFWPTGTGDASYHNVLGTVAGREDGYTIVNRIGSAENKPNYEYFLTNGNKVIIYDCATGDYKLGTEADLEVGDTVVVSLTSLALDAIVIYRNPSFN